MTEPITIIEPPLCSSCPGCPNGYQERDFCILSVPYFLVTTTTNLPAGRQGTTQSPQRCNKIATSE